MEHSADPSVFVASKDQSRNSSGTTNRRSTGKSWPLHVQTKANSGVSSTQPSKLSRVVTNSQSHIGSGQRDAAYDIARGRSSSRKSNRVNRSGRTPTPSRSLNSRQPSAASTHGKYRSRLQTDVGKNPTTDSKGERTSFQVRVFVSSLTGVKSTVTDKKRPGNRNELVFGYVSLTKSGKNVILSKPLMSRLGGSGQNELKVSWDHQPTSDGGGLTKSKNSLQFSLKLRKENETATAGDSTSICQQQTFRPEVVKISVGLKCGERKYLLGIANLVVAGRRLSQEPIDLAVRSSSQPSENGQKGKMRIFGPRRKEDSGAATIGNRYYRLTSNATLSVRVDSRPGRPSRQRTVNDDDASLLTDFTYNTHGTKASLADISLRSRRQHRVERTPAFSRHSDRTSFSPQQDSSVAAVRFVGENSPRGGKRGGYPTIDDSRVSHGASRRLGDKNMPMNFVVVGQNDGHSMTSALSAPDRGFPSSLMGRPCFPLTFCGAAAELSGVADSTSDFSADSLREEDVRGRAAKVRNAAGPQPNFDSKRAGSGGENSLSIAPAMEEREKGKRRKMRGSDVRDARDVIAGRDPRDRCELSSVDTIDITEDTYTDLKQAQATLLRYAMKAGIQMEDLLDGTDSKRRPRQGKEMGENPLSS